jgi:hypothetical protein
MVKDLQEVGIETTDHGPFLEDVFWLINRETDGLRVPQNSLVFKQFMDYCDSLEGFDWQSFKDAMCCTDNRYFLCWKRVIK